MKLLANYDASGKIHSVTWYNAPEGITLTLTPAHGEFVSEIQGHDLKGVPTEQTLRNLITSHAIAAPLPQSKLTKKP